NIKLVPKDGAGSYNELAIKMEAVALGVVVQFQTLDSRKDMCSVAGADASCS
ncbi:hypothetical protein ACN42_g7475, partial [Penicillium freii]